MISDAQKAYYKQWRKDNRQKVNAYNRQHRNDNLEHYRAKDKVRDKARVRVRDQSQYQIQYRKRNRAEILAKRREHYYANRDRLLQEKRDNPPDKEHRRAYNREWCRKNPAKLHAHRAKRKYAIETTEEESKRINDFMLRIRAMKSVRCNYCDTPVAGDKVDFDHVIPLAKGGKHVLSNLCAACEHCNATKYSKLPHEWPKKGQVFLSL